MPLLLCLCFMSSSMCSVICHVRVKDKCLIGMSSRFFRQVHPISHAARYSHSKNMGHALAAQQLVCEGRGGCWGQMSGRKAGTIGQDWGNLFIKFIRVTLANKII